jgi:hypothetical protein
MLLRRFPGQTSSQDIYAWKTPPPPTLIPATAAFAALTQHPDQCGVVELAGKAVGASFVGAVAACLAISETIRDLHGGRGHDLLTIDLLTNTARCSAAARPIEPVSAPLKLVLSPAEHL